MGAFNVAFGLLAGALLLGAGAARAAARPATPKAPGIADQGPAVKWKTPAAGLRFDPYFQAAEQSYDLPAGLLSRVAYQESRYKIDAVSPAGAQGLMQFMPATAKDFSLDPLDPIASIYAAAKYLRTLHDKFGSWQLALAAYNWGQGNVARKGIAEAPKETRDYYAAIMRDVGLG